MPRQARLDSPGTLHHVMVRGIEGIPIFRGNPDRQSFIQRLRDVSIETGTRVLAWALMENHVHLLLFSGIRGISQFMRRLLTGYAIEFNRRHERFGHLFQNRYKSIVCEEDAYLLELVRYIHLNPLRRLVVKDMEHLEEYPWTGHGVLVGKMENDWQERKYVLDFFAGREKKAIQGYREFMRKGKDQGQRPELVGGGLLRSLGGWSQVLSPQAASERMEHDARILGGGDFVAGILKEADQKLRRQMKAEGKAESIEVILQKVCSEEGVKEEDLKKGNRNRKVSRVRAKVAYRLNHELGVPKAEIARHLGVCTSAIAKAVRNLES